jgi:hypothetical protein
MSETRNNTSRLTKKLALSRGALFVSFPRAVSFFRSLFSRAVNDGDCDGLQTVRESFLKSPEDVSSSEPQHFCFVSGHDFSRAVESGTDRASR